MRPRDSFRLTRIVLLAFAIMPAMASPLLAQRLLSDPVIVAIPDNFPSKDAKALIIRYPSPDTKDFILIRSQDATAETLVTALAVLRKVRLSGSPPATQVTGIQGFVPRGNQIPRLLPNLGGAMRALLRQPSAVLGNLGSGRWIEISPELR